MTDFPALPRIGDPLILPNVWDVASARCLVHAGFPALGTTSLGVAAATACPTVPVPPLPRLCTSPHRLSRLPVHLTVDLETGSVATAVAVAEAGAAGVNMEDGMGPAGAHAALIRSVKQEAPRLFVNARTDTPWLRPGDLAEALRRVRLYADAGADGLFVPSMAEPAESQLSSLRSTYRSTFCSCLDGTPSPRSETGGVRRISTGSLLFRARWPRPWTPPSPFMTAVRYEPIYRPTRRSIGRRPSGDVAGASQGHGVGRSATPSPCGRPVV